MQLISHFNAKLLQQNIVVRSDHARFVRAVFNLRKGFIALQFQELHQVAIAILNER